LAYQPPASSTFLSEQTSHQPPASSTFLSEQTSTNHQPPAKRIGWGYKSFSSDYIYNATNGKWRNLSLLKKSTHK
jgi:hypothetical protein